MRQWKAAKVLQNLSDSKQMDKAIWDVVNENIPGISLNPVKPLVIKHNSGMLIDDSKSVSDCLINRFAQVGGGE